MKKAWKWLTPAILIFLALILAFIMFFVYIRFIKNGEPYDPNNSDTWFNEYNMVFEWEIHMLRPGTSMENVFKILGKPNCRIPLNSALVHVYRCFGGRYFYMSMDYVDGEFTYTGSDHFNGFEEECALSNNEADFLTPLIVCLIISALMILEGYAAIKLLRKKKVVLQKAAASAPQELEQTRLEDI